MADTKIDWATKVWNPVTGCTPVGAGCHHCYAARFAKRLKAMGKPGYEKGFDHVACHPDRLEQPLRWRKPQVVFVNSMGDVLHEAVPLPFVGEILQVIQEPECRFHQFVLLTKRPERLSIATKWRGNPFYSPIPNLWIGASVWDQESAERAVPHVLKQRLGHPILCAEPLLDEIDWLRLGGLRTCSEWVIVGCESGPHRRTCNEMWIQTAVEQCRQAGVPLFVKQLSLFGGGVRRDPAEWPPELRVRQLPWATDAGGPARSETSERKS